MRLLFLNHNVARRGGTFYRAYHFARHLVDRGHDVTLLTISPHARLRFQQQVSDGVRVVETPDLLWGSARSGWDPWDALRRAIFTRRGDWDLVHAFDCRPVVVLPALAARRRVPVVMDWADWWGRGGTIEERQPGTGLRTFIRPVETFFEEAFRTRATSTTVISTALHDRAVGLGVAPETIATIPQGSDVVRIRPRDKHECRSAVGVPPGTPLVGYLGVLTRPDASLLFETFAALRRRLPGCRLVIIGNHKATVPATDGIIETGFIPFDDMTAWLGACDALLLPLKNTVSSRGRWPSKINDYLAAGRPVVASAVGDVADLFARHDIGRAVADDPAAMAAAACELLETPAALERCGVNARALAESELAWPLLSEQLEAHYLRSVS